MRFASFVSVVSAVAFVSFASAKDADSTNDSDVLNLTKDNFASTIEPEPLILVEFFAPWSVVLSTISLDHWLSSRTGVVTANLLLPITRRQPLLLKRRQLSLPKWIASTKQTSASRMASRVTRGFNLTVECVVSRADYPLTAL